jgi:hypothetical protein
VETKASGALSNMNIILSMLPPTTAQVPKSFQELITAKEYAPLLTAIMPKVTKKTQSVLEGVKKRGAVEGDVMDIDTEREIIRQIMREAFGREVISFLQLMTTQNSIRKANLKESIASAEDECASWDQVPPSVLDAICDPSVAVGVVDGFMGEDWCEVLHSDTSRFIRSHKLTQQVPGREHMILVEEESMKDQYPALEVRKRCCDTMRISIHKDLTHRHVSILHLFPQELLVKMHALPHEINGKRDLKLSRAFSGNNMICSYMVQTPLNNHIHCYLPLCLHRLTTPSPPSVGSNHNIKSIFFYSSLMSRGISSTTGTAFPSAWTGEGELTIPV